MNKILILFFSISSCVSAQPAINSAMPDKLIEIRQAQQQLEKNGTTIFFLDENKRSVSRIEGVPEELANVKIADKDSLEVVIDSLYPYFGFTESESLRYGSTVKSGATTIYHFFEYINDIQAEVTIGIAVDNASQRIKQIQGWAVLDRDFDTTHFLDENGAIRLVLDHVTDTLDTPAKLQDDGNEVRLLYREWGDDQALAPWWLVNLKGIGTYFIDPVGKIGSPFDIHTR